VPWIFLFILHPFLNAAGWALVFPQYRTYTISFPDRAKSLLTRRWYIHTVDQIVSGRREEYYKRRYVYYCVIYAKYLNFDDYINHLRGG
jgi:hypothetical protein